MLRFCFVAIICCLLFVCCLCNENTGFNERASNDGHKLVIGGKTEQNPRDPKYRHLAEESALKYLLDIGNYRYHKIMQVTRATTQVVSGSLTRISFIVAPTNCVLRGGLIPIDPPCKVMCTEHSTFLSCYSEIWEQPWLDKKQINVSCDRVY